MSWTHLLVILTTMARRIQELEIDNQHLRQQIADSDKQRLKEPRLVGD